jgi:GT2 family glycosyltransferase
LSANPADLAGSPTVSVIIAAFAMERWDDLRQAVESVREQTVPVLETIVVIDHNPDLLSRARRELPGTIVIPNAGGPGASAARNSGVAVSHGEVLAFLDDDAAASPTWLQAILLHFAHPDVVGVGCGLVPLWAGSRPRWFPREFDWAVGASYRGMPERAAPVRNVWSCGMAIHRHVFEAIGGFREDFGKVGHRSRPEDTDLCLRAAAAQPRGTWMYEPAATVGHRVPVTRTSLSFFLRRCLLPRWRRSTAPARARRRSAPTPGGCCPEGWPAACGISPAAMRPARCAVWPSWRGCPSPRPVSWRPGRRPCFIGKARPARPPPPAG